MGGSVEDLVEGRVRVEAWPGGGRWVLRHLGVEACLACSRLVLQRLVVEIGQVFGLEVGGVEVLDVAVVDEVGNGQGGVESIEELGEQDEE